MYGLKTAKFGPNRVNLEVFLKKRKKWGKKSLVQFFFFKKIIKNRKKADGNIFWSKHRTPATDAALYQQLDFETRGFPYTGVPKHAILQLAVVNSWPKASTAYTKTRALGARKEYKTKERSPSLFGRHTPRHRIRDVYEMCTPVPRCMRWDGPPN